ncbi:MAG TPA: carboxypeptidase regulatory-like domain-containing protein [Verrucomicrobiae bacterium]|nr:carboxypeptidase regulatory-like domain-containing protein [Verrucomicrobiae bacterium]
MMHLKPALLGLFLFTATACFAQFETSEVLGTVRDASQRPVAKASVTLINQETQIQAKTTTDDSGNYDFFNVKVGRYTITVEAPGFSKFSSPDINIEVNARQRVDAALQLGAVSDVVTVSDQASEVETDTSAHSQVVNSQAIVELPLNGRQYSSLALLSTNVHISQIAAAFSPSATPREGAFNVNGMRSTYNNFLMDGLDNNSYGTSNQNYSSQVVQPSPDAIAEFRVITSNFSAEYGRAGGGIINAVMRSGTNDLHVSVWEFLRNTDLNAIGFFKPATGKPTLHRNQFGTAIGGPFIKNKLFFFTDYEGYRQTQGYVNFYSVPSTNDRLGILPVTVVNPLNGNVYAAGTKIPLAQINPFANAALTDLPAPFNSTRANNLLATIPLRDYNDKYDAKLDYQVNDKMTAFLRWSQRKDIYFFGPSDPGASGGDGNGFIHAIQQQAAAGYTWTVSPTSLFEARLGFTHVLGGKTPPFLGGPDIAAQFGISGEPSSLAGGFPTQIITGYSNPTFGRQTTNPQFQNPTSWNPKFNYSIVHGRHSLKAGYEFLAIHTEVLDINPLYGSDTYSGQYSKPTCAQLGQAATCTVPSDATSYDLADFYFGLPSTIAQGSNLTTNLRQHVHSLYVQDDWRVSPKLTINAGLRWEFATPLWDRDNYWSNFDPNTNTLVRAKPGSLFDRALVNPDYKDWGPRIGGAFSIDSKTSLRAGYGISYTFFNRPGSAIEGINGPLAVFGTLTQTALPGQAGFLTVQNGFAAGIGTTFNPVTTNNDYIPADTRWPMIQSWVVSIQREVVKDTVVEVAYNGNHSSRLPIIGDYNQANPNAPGGTLSVQARRPDQAFGAITWVDPVGVNDYNGLSVRFEKRFSKGLYVLNSFTWGHSIGDSEQALEQAPGQNVANQQNIRNLAAEFGPSSYDVKFNNVTSVVYQLPFGKGRQFLKSANRIEELAIGGWEINAINMANTGIPINVFYAPSTAQDVTGLPTNSEYRGTSILRPNIAGPLPSLTRTQEIADFFGPPIGAAGSVFTNPTPDQPFGNLGRNAFRAPGFWQWDLGVTKNFNFTERLRMQFRSEFFNVLNHTNLGIPNQQANSAAFGSITGTYPARQVQFGLKLMF